MVTTDFSDLGHGVPPCAGALLFLSSSLEEE